MGTSAGGPVSGRVAIVMSFDTVTYCGSTSSIEILVPVAVWFVPTILFALRSCRPARERGRWLTFWSFASAVLALAITGIWEGELPEWFVMLLVLAALIVPTVIAAVGLYRLTLKR